MKAPNDEPKNDAASPKNEGEGQEELLQENGADEMGLDPEGGYDDPEEGERAEKIAMCSQNRINVNALPNQDYLELKVTTITDKNVFIY